MADSNLICTNCGNQAKSVSKAKGSLWIEIMLWIASALGGYYIASIFYPVGLIYSIYRLLTKAKVCSKCSASNLIPVNTPQGQKLVEGFSLKS